MLNYGPYKYVWPKASQSILIKPDPTESVHPNEFFVPPVQHLDSVLIRLVSTKEEATVVIPQWTNTSWYATAIRACFEYQVLLSSDTRDTTPTPWAMLTCHFLHRYDGNQETGKRTNTRHATETQQGHAPYNPTTVNRTAHFAVAVPPPSRHNDASPGGNRGARQHWPSTSARHCAHACCAPRAEPPSTGPRPHGFDDQGFSAR